MLRTEVLKEKVKQARQTALVTLPVAASAALPITSFAADTSSSPTGQMFDAVASGMQTAIQDMVSAVGTTVGSLIPLVFPLVALGIGISICIVMVRRVSNNA